MRQLDVDWDSLPLGVIPDAEIAQQVGCSETTARDARIQRGLSPSKSLSIDWDGLPLGQMTDREIARRIECSKTTVRDARLQKRISPKPRGRDWDNQPLGKMPDVEIARQIGCSLQSVSLARYRRGITPYRGEHVCACGRQFKATRKHQVYCSTKCRGIAKYYRYRVNDNTGGALMSIYIAMARLRRTIKEGKDVEIN